MSKARILIVEDEAIIAMEIETSLQNLGYEVISVVNTGDAAIKKAEEDKPDLILMDIRIKGEKDGIETAEIIRNKFSIPIIFSTAYLDEERIERAKITMPFGYVLKPIQERELRVTLEMALYVAKVDFERKKADKELQIRNRYIESIVENLPIGFAVNTIDDGDVKFINDHFQEIYGWSRDVLTNTSIFFEKVFPDVDYRKEMQAKIISDMESGDPKRMRWNDLKIVTSSGEIRYVYAFNKPLFDQNLMISTVQDVTARKTAEDKIKASLNEKETLLLKIRKSEEKLEQAQKLARIGHWELDLKTANLSWSNEVYEIFGQNKQTFKGTVESFESFVHPDDLPGIIEKRESSLSTKNEVEVEYRIIRSDGNIAYIHQIASNIFDDKGNLIRIIGTIQDVTSQKMEHLKLIESEKRYKQAQKLSKIGYWDWFMDTGELVWSDEVFEIFGQDKETFEVTTESFEKAIYSDDFNAFIREREKALEEERDVNIEHRIKLSDDSIRWVHEIAEIIKNEKGDVTRVMGVVQDITDRKHTEKRLQKRLKEARLLLDVSQKVSKQNDLQEILQSISDSVAKLMGIETTALYLLEDKEIYLGATTPNIPLNFPDTMRRTSLANHPHIEKTIKSKKPVILSNTEIDVLTAEEREAVELRKLKSLVYIPFQNENRVIGVLILGTTSKTYKFTNDDIELCCTLINHLSSNIQNARISHH